MDSALAKKLLLKPGLSGAAINPPPGYLDRLDNSLTTELRPDLDFVQVFARDRADLERLAPAAVKSVKPDGLLWVCYLKGGQKAGTDLNRDLLWEAMKPLGATGVSLVAIDDAWSAMRFRPSDKAGKRVLSDVRPEEPFKMKRHPFKGEGLQPGIREGDWEQIRDIIYGGR